MAYHIWNGDVELEDEGLGISAKKEHDFISVFKLDFVFVFLFVWHDAGKLAKTEQIEFLWLDVSTDVDVLVDGPGVGFQVALLDVVGLAASHDHYAVFINYAFLEDSGNCHSGSSLDGSLE